MTFPLVRELAVYGIPVTVTCRVLKLCPQRYYRWLDQPLTDAELDEAWIANAVFDAHRDDPEFGNRFLADELHAAGVAVSDRPVWRICRDNGWWSVFARPQRYTGSRPGTPAHDDLAQRVVNADALNQVWVSDLTEHLTYSPNRQGSPMSSSRRRKVPRWRCRQRSSDLRPGHRHRV